jgi:hypothetical protein
LIEIGVPIRQISRLALMSVLRRPSSCREKFPFHIRFGKRNANKRAYALYFLLLEIGCGAMNKVAKILMNLGAVLVILGFTLPFLGVELGAQIYNILQLGGLGLAVVFWLAYTFTKPKS